MKTGAAALALAMLLAGCAGAGDDDRDASPLAGIAPREGVTSLRLRADVEFEMTGDIDAAWEGETPLNVLTSVGLGAPRNFWLLTVGILPADILEVGEQLKLLMAFDLVGYGGEGEYTIAPPRAGGLTEEEVERFREDPEPFLEEQAAGIRSATKLVVDRGGEVTNLNVMTQPCSLEVGPEGLVGTIECPEVTNGAEVVAYRWSWEADPNAVLDDLSNLPGSDRNPDADSPDPDTGDDEATTTTSAPVRDPDRYELTDDFPLEVNIAPDDCAPRGGPVVVEINTIATASITLVVAYSDSQPHGSTILGFTDPEGSFNWGFAVPPDAPDGQADLLISVSKEGGPSGGGIVPAFVVEAACT